MLSGYKNVLFLGRHLSYPLALESALKLKELAYIHAEAYPGGELKHGPLALIDDVTPTVAFLPGGEAGAKLLSNLAEIRARGGKIFLFHDVSVAIPPGLVDHALALPGFHPDLAPLVYAPLGQLLAYHTALTLGTDIDQPRNLAKSVTVE